MTTAPCATLLVGLSPIYAEGIASILKSTGNFQVVGKIWSAREAHASATPDICILDGGRSLDKNIEDLDLLRIMFPEAHCVMLDGDADRPGYEIMQSFQHGARAYLLQPATQRLLNTLELVRDGQVMIPQRAFEALPRPGHPLHPQVLSRETLRRRLSPREIEVMRHLIDGKSNKVIGRFLKCSEMTIKVHVKSILRKLGMHNRTMAALWGAQHLESLNGKVVILPTMQEAIVIDK